MAKKFSFRLEPLLKIRAHKVEEAKDSLNQIIQFRIQKAQQVDERNEYCRRIQEQRAAAGSLPVSELQAAWQHENAVREEIKNLEKELVQLQEIEGLRRQILSEAMKKEKVLEKLKEKKKLLHTAEVAREEQAFMDDISQRKVSTL